VITTRLGFVRQPRPGGRWRARYLDPETPRLVPVATTFATKVEADRWLAQAQAVRDLALPHNPCVNRSTRLPRHTAKDHPVLSPAEVDDLASAMKHPLDGTLVRVLA